MNQRHTFILDRLDGQESCSYQELSDQLHVSTMTIRRDVDVLASRGAVIKSLGGVRKAQDPSAVLLYETTLASRLSVQLPEKRAIAETALGLIGDRQTIYLDGSTTCLELAKAIAHRRRGLTVVTNSALVCVRLGGNEANTVVGLGGQYDPASASFVGTTAEEAAQRFFVDIAFFSTKGFVPLEGTFESFMPTFRIKQIIARQCHDLMLLVDHTKFGQRGIESRVHSRVRRFSELPELDIVPGFDAGESFLELCLVLLNNTEPIRWENDDGDLSVFQILLILQVLICREKDIKRLLRQLQEGTVLDRRPASFLNGLVREFRQNTFQVPRQALINQNIHFERLAFRKVSLAASRRATTSSRLTEGKFSRNTSREHPSSKYSNRVRTGTLVPTNTVVPPRISGSE